MSLTVDLMNRLRQVTTERDALRAERAKLEGALREADQAQKEKGMCLHCAFRRAATLKWGDVDNNADAFQDICNSAANIAAELLAALDDEGKMKFMNAMMERAAIIENEPEQMIKH